MGKGLRDKGLAGKWLVEVGKDVYKRQPGGH